jgi:MFS family permease
MLHVLRQRNCAMLWLGGLVSALGSTMLYIALPFYVYLHTGSTLATGGMIVVEIVPSIVLGSLTGVLVDRWDRRRVMFVCDILRAAIILLLLTAPLADALWLLYVVAFAEAVVSLLFEQAYAALLPRVVPDEHLIPANALAQLSNNIIRLVAPALGTAILATVGLSALVFLNSTTYAFSAIAILALRLYALPVDSDVRHDAPTLRANALRDSVR